MSNAKDFRTLITGTQFRQVSPTGELGPVLTFVSCAPARARGFYVVRVAERRPGVGDELSLRAGTKVVIL